MAGINPISGMRPPMTQAAGLQIPAKKTPGQDASFGQVIRKFVENTEQAQNASNEAIQDLLTGKNDDVLPVVSAVAKADLSFKLLMGVRNKVIDAYKQTMNMQI